MFILICYRIGYRLCLKMQAIQYLHSCQSDLCSYFNEVEKNLLLVDLTWGLTKYLTKKTRQSLFLSAQYVEPSTSSYTFVLNCSIGTIAMFLVSRLSKLDKLHFKSCSVLLTGL